MILEERGFTRVSLLDVVGRIRRRSQDGTLIEDWLLVDYNGNRCKVGIGFFGTTDMTFTLPKRAKIMHMVIDERSANEYLRFPVFKEFDFSG